MTHQQKSYIKNNWRGAVTIANFIMILLIFLFKSGFTSGAEVTKIKTDIKQNTADILENSEDIKDHKEDEIVHMPFQEKIKVFVPRVELDSRLKNIEDTLIRIEKNQNK